MSGVGVRWLLLGRNGFDAMFGRGRVAYYFGYYMVSVGNRNGRALQFINALDKTKEASFWVPDPIRRPDAMELPT